MCPAVSPNVVLTSPATKRGIVSGDDAASEFNDALPGKLDGELIGESIDDRYQLPLAAIRTVACLIHPGSDTLFGHALEAICRV
jgi:hypothetical protein